MPICYLPTMQGPSHEEFYRQLHTGNDGDVEFYERVVGQTTVLELGSGWGRVTAPLSRACQSIVGLEQSSRFCAMARDVLQTTDNARVMQHDIRTPWDGSPAALRGGESLGRFERIIAPYNLLYALGGEDGVASALRFVMTHLEPEGEFWFDVYPMDAFQRDLDRGESAPEDDDEPVGTFSWDGRIYPVVESSILDARAQSLLATYRAVDESSLEAPFFESTLEHHYLLIPQIERLLADAGLEISLLLGGFDGRPYDEDAEQVVICVQPSQRG